MTAYSMNVLTQTSSAPVGIRITRVAVRAQVNSSIAIVALRNGVGPEANWL